MACKKIIEEKLAIPQKISVSAVSNVLNVSGPNGKCAKSLKLKSVKISSDAKEVTVSGPLREVNTVLSHIKNMFVGVQKGFSQKMKVIHAHFPMSIQVSAKEVSIKNFAGEKKPRFAKIIGDTKVELKGADITVSGPNKDDVGQTIANLRTASKIKKLDSRVFQDGIYPVLE